MNDIKIKFKGDAETLKAFAEYAKGCGLETRLDELLLNSKKGGGAYVVAIFGSVAVIATAIANFQEAHKTQIIIETPTGTFKEQNYSAEELEKILPSVKTNIFIQSVASEKVSKP